MTVATLKQALEIASTNNFALAGLVVLGWEDASAFVEAAEETRLPIILQAGPGCRRYLPVPVLGKMFRHLAEQASIPVVCHFDHALTRDECREGLDHGFSSVMIDGSRLTLAENIKITAQVVNEAQRTNVSVEGEVGYVGYIQGAKSIATSPLDAQRFEQETGVDALAISVGNQHLDTGKSAEIDFAILSAIEAVTRIPLVLHGGSGIPSGIRKHLAHGHRIRKFNIGTELRIEFAASLRTSLANLPHEFDRNKLFQPVVKAIRNKTITILRELGPR